MDNVENLTLRQIFGALKPSHVWSIILVLAAVLSTTAGVSYKLRSTMADNQLAAAEAGLRGELEECRSAQSNFRGLQTKERFLALYLKYFLARQDHEANPTTTSEQFLQETEDGFRDYIFSLLDRGDEASDEIDLHGLYVGKSASAEASVKFGYDGSVWPVPNQFGLHTLD